MNHIGNFSRATYNAAHAVSNAAYAVGDGLDSGMSLLNSGLDKAVGLGYSGVSKAVPIACEGILRGTKVYTKTLETTKSVASTAFEITNDIRKGVTYVVCNPLQSCKDGIKYHLGLNDVADGNQTRQVLPDKPCPDGRTKTDQRTWMTRQWQAAKSYDVALLKFGRAIALSGLYATQEEFRNAVNTTAGVLGSVALEGTKYAASGAVKALEVMGSASLEGAKNLYENPQGTIESVANHTVVIGGTVLTMGSLYLFSKILNNAELMRITDKSKLKWYQRASENLKMASYFGASAITGIATIVLASATHQAYNKL